MNGDLTKYPSWHQPNPIPAFNEITIELIINWSIMFVMFWHAKNNYGF